MAKKKKSNLPVVTRIFTKDRGPGQSFVGPEGYWEDSKYMFVKKYEVEEAFFYRDLSPEYRHRQPNGIPGPYDRARLDATFCVTVLSEVPYHLIAKYANFSESEMDEVVRAVFHLGPEIQWRWPRHGERIYHRPADGYTGVWLEHLRPGWTPKCHIFIKHSLMQLNSKCGQVDRDFPSFNLFHNLFTLIHSNKDPFYELRFRGEECGYSSGDAKPVIMQSSLKGWNREWMYLKGWDIEFMPLFAKRMKDIEEQEMFKFEGEAFEKIHAFCECLGFQMTRDTFMKHEKMYELGCLPHYNPELVERMGKSRATLALASQLKKLTGVHQTKVPLNQVGTDSETGTGTGARSGVRGEGRGESELPREVEDPLQTDHVIEEEDDPDVETVRAKKKPRISTVDQDRILGLEPVNLDGSGSGAGGSRSGCPKKRNELGVGTFSMKELEEIVGKIPEEKDWRAMDRVDMPEMVRNQLVVWAQVGILLAGASAKANDQAVKIKELTGQLSERDKQVSEKDEQISEKDRQISQQALEISELKERLAASVDKVSGLESDLKKAGDRAVAAENESGLLKKRNGELESELGARRPEGEIIAAFKDSEEYTDALASAVAEKLQRCWLVAERLIKTDAESSFDKFVDLYVAAEEAFDETGVEPAPYDGPNPISPQISTTVDARTTELVNPEDALHVDGTQPSNTPNRT